MATRKLVTIFGADKETMRALVSRYHVDVLNHTAKNLGDPDSFSVDAIVDDEMIATLQGASYKVDIQESSDNLESLKKLVGKGNRYQ